MLPFLKFQVHYGYDKQERHIFKIEESVRIRILGTHINDLSNLFVLYIEDSQEMHIEHLNL